MAGHETGTTESYGIEPSYGAEPVRTESHGDGAVSEPIRPVAVVPGDAGRAILVELALHDVQRGGVWLSDPTRWAAYDAPWTGPGQPGAARLVGSIQVAHDDPTHDAITLHRATVTRRGTELGWTVTRLCDAALGFGNLDLATCPRASLAGPAARP